MGAGAAVRDLLGAVSFLTRVPTGTGPVRPTELARFVPWFPLVGALVGVAVGGLYAGASVLLPPLVAAAVAVTAGVAITGAFHEDGLGDTADAFLGGHGRLGTFGVLAVAASLLLRVAAVAALPPAAALAALPAAHALSRAAAVGVMAAVPPAAETGLGAAYVRALGGRQALLGVAAGIVIAAPLLRAWALPAAALAALAAAALGRLAHRRLGGVSGDVLGAVQQAGEILTLLVAVAAL
jgi:adenosylcobinamide-GDP ribazoletransferase